MTQSKTFISNLHNYFFELIRIFVWKPNFFQGQAIAKMFSVLQPTYKGDTTYHVWFTSNNSLAKSKNSINLFKIIANFRLETWLFWRQAIAEIFSVLHFMYQGDTAHQVWYNSDHFLTLWKVQFSKLFIRIKREFTYKNLTPPRDKL